MTRVITVGNRKGGSGKTTTAVSLAAGLAHRGHRVLLVDLDPQAHASLSLGFRDLETGTTYTVLAEAGAIPDHARSTYHPGLFVLAGDRRLADYERQYTPVKEARLRASQALEGARESYEYVVFDTPPTLGLLTVSALIASGELVIPMQAHFLSLDGLAEMIRVVQVIDRSYGCALRVRGVVPTFHQERLRLSRAVLDDVRAHLGPDAVLPSVRICVALAEAPSYGMTVYQYAPQSKGAADYQALVLAMESPGKDTST